MISRCTLAVLVALFFALFSTARAQDTLRSTGKVTTEGNAAFVMKSVIVHSGGTINRTTDFYDTHNKRILSVSTEYETNPLKVVSVDLEDFRNGRKEKVANLGNGNYRLTFKENSKEETESETVEEDDEEPLITSYMIAPLIRQELSALLKGNEFEFELAVTSRLETVGFDLEYIGTKTVAGQECYEVKMTASSWIIRQLVDPLYFYIRKSAPHRLVQYKGRLTPKTPEGDDMDGVVTYTYQE